MFRQFCCSSIAQTPPSHVFSANIVPITVRDPGWLLTSKFLCVFFKKARKLLMNERKNKTPLPRPPVVRKENPFCSYYHREKSLNISWNGCYCSQSGVGHCGRAIWLARASTLMPLVFISAAEKADSLFSESDAWAAQNRLVGVLFFFFCHFALPINVWLCHWIFMLWIVFQQMCWELCLSSPNLILLQYFRLCF